MVALILFICHYFHVRGSIDRGSYCFIFATVLYRHNFIATENSSRCHFKFESWIANAQRFEQNKATLGASAALPLSPGLHCQNRCNKVSPASFCAELLINKQVSLYEVWWPVCLLSRRSRVILISSHGATCGRLQELHYPYNPNIRQFQYFVLPFSSEESLLWLVLCHRFSRVAIFIAFTFKCPSVADKPRCFQGPSLNWWYHYHDHPIVRRPFCIKFFLHFWGEFHRRLFLWTPVYRGSFCHYSGQ